MQSLTDNTRGKIYRSELNSGIVKRRLQLIQTLLEWEYFSPIVGNFENDEYNGDKYVKFELKSIMNSRNLYFQFYFINSFSICSSKIQFILDALSVCIVLNLLF